MKAVLALLLAWWLSGAALAQSPYAGSFGGSSSITSGATPLTCASGTTGVLFQSSGKVACTANATLDASGNLAAARFDVTSGLTILTTGTLLRDGSTANFGLGASNRVTWSASGDGAGTPDTGLTRTSAAVVEVNNGTAGSLGTIKAANATLTGLSTGTNADFLCLSAGGVVLLQTTACTISSMRFKENIFPVDDHDALSIVEQLRPIAFNMRAGERPNPDPNFAKRQLGLTAENVAAVDPRMAIYEDDEVTPKSYRQEAVIAALVGAVRELKVEFEAYRRAHP